MLTEFEELSKLILDGVFEQSSYLRTVYLAFLDKLMTCYDFTAQSHYSSMIEGGSGQGGGSLKASATTSLIIISLLRFFQDFNYPESRIKDVEPFDFLKNSVGYKSVLAKFKAIHQRV